MTAKRKEIEMDNEKKERFDLNFHTARLLHSEPFFTAISRRIQKRSSSSVPTAGVYFDEKSLQLNMVYNPKFFEKLTEKEKQAVIKHEYYHVVLGHITDRLPKDKENRMIWNIAADLAINSFLKNELPKNCCVPGVAPFEKFPEKECAEWYYNKLLKDKEKYLKQCGADGEGIGQFDSHDKWEGSDSEDEEA